MIVFGLGITWILDGFEADVLDRPLRFVRIDGTWLVRGVVDVAPTIEWLAEDLLVGALKAQLHSESLLAEPIVYTLDEGTFSPYERRVLIK